MQKRSAGKATGGAGGTLPKKPKAAAPNPKTTIGTKWGEATKEQEEDETHNVFTVELDTLHCEICFLPFESHVYTCKNGHAACAKCCDRVGRKCSFCSEPIGDSRCRAMEKILAGMIRHCKFSKNGCPETFKFTEMRSHEEECRYAPYWCPFDGCAFVSMNLYAHIREQHATAASTMSIYGYADVTLEKGETFRAILQGDVQRVCFLLNGCDVVTSAQSLSLVRVYPRPEPEERVGTCVITVVASDTMPGWMSLSGTGTVDVQFVRRLQGFQPKSSLLVPDGLYGDTGSFKVKLYLKY